MPYNKHRNKKQKGDFKMTEDIQAKPYHYYWVILRDTDGFNMARIGYCQHQEFQTTVRLVFYFSGNERGYPVENYTILSEVIQPNKY